MSNHIVYIANARMPTEKAHGLQIMNMCESFARLPEVTVELIIPNRRNAISADPFSYYKKESLFTITTLNCLDAISRASWLGFFAYAVEVLSFAWSVGKQLRKMSVSGIKDSGMKIYGMNVSDTKASDLIYTRDLASLFFAPRGLSVAYEAHNLPTLPGWFFRFLLKKCSRIVAITNGLKDDIVALGFPAEKILVAPDAVDSRLFATIKSKESCRAKVGLPQLKKIIMYTGHLYAWKGVYTLLEAAVQLPDLIFVFVGGTDEDFVVFKKRVAELNLKNVLALGHKDAVTIPDYIGAADILVIPNSAKARISARYTSPMKLFEYMACGRPIVASDLPSLREILNEKLATFFAPDDPTSLESAIVLALSNTQIMSQKSEFARELALTRHTWDKRAKEIVNFLKH